MPTARPSHPDTHPERSLALLCAGVLAAPLAWAFDFMSRYLLIRTASRRDSVTLMHGATLLSLLVVGAGVFICLRYRRKDDSPQAATHRRVALWGLALAAYFALAIIAQAYPTLVLGPRDLS
jgi:uncharacterized membrane protein